MQNTYLTKNLREGFNFFQKINVFFQENYKDDQNGIIYPENREK